VRAPRVTLLGAFVAALALVAALLAALAALVMRSAEDSDSLDAAADRIERAARDFVDALRELAHERKPTSEGT